MTLLGGPVDAIVNQVSKALSIEHFVLGGMG